MRENIPKGTHKLKNLQYLWSLVCLVGRTGGASHPAEQRGGVTTRIQTLHLVCLWHSWPCGLSCELKVAWVISSVLRGYQTHTIYHDSLHPPNFVLVIMAVAPDFGFPASMKWYISAQVYSEISFSYYIGIYFFYYEHKSFCISIQAERVMGKLISVYPALRVQFTIHDSALGGRLPYSVVTHTHPLSAYLAPNWKLKQKRTLQAFAISSFMSRSGNWEGLLRLFLKGTEHVPTEQISLNSDFDDNLWCFSGPRWRLTRAHKNLRMSTRLSKS